MPHFKCPRCATVLQADDPATLVCHNCGFPGPVRQAAPAPASAPAPAAAPVPSPTGPSAAPPPQQPPQWSPGGQAAPYAQPPPYGQQPYPGQQKTSGKAIASLVLGLVSLMAYFAIITAPLAIIFGSKAKKEIRANAALRGTGMATAGIILGSIMLGVILIVILAAIVFVLVSDAGTLPTTGP